MSIFSTTWEGAKIDMRFLALGFLLAQTACASAPAPGARVVVQEVRVAVPVHCQPDPAMIAPRTYPDSRDAIRAAADIDRIIRLMAAGRLIRDDEIAALRAAIAACARPTG